jgi:Nucleotidyltransferase of unknown function (DUF6036)
MRKISDGQQIRRFMRAFGAEAASDARIYFTGGATAVLLGWRESTIDIDLRIFPESDRLFRALPNLKESLEINIELACPADFIPELPGWEGRSLFIAREGKLSFFHYDLYSQALAKIERSHQQDLQDVRELIRGKWVEARRILGYFETIEPQLYRYPAIDPPSFRRRVEQILV